MQCARGKYKFAITFTDLSSVYAFPAFLPGIFSLKPCSSSSLTMHMMGVKNNKSAEWIQEMYYTFPEYEVCYQCRLRVLREKRTVRVVTCTPFDHFLELLILRWHDPVYAPGAPQWHCNLWCWEITGAGRPGRHSQLGRAPPVRWGHSLPQTDTLIFFPNMWVFHSFSKASHSRVRRCTFQLSVRLNLQG